MALTDIAKVRLEVQDNTPGLYIISDDEIQYFLDKNNNNITRASIDTVKTILFNLSMRGDETVDILSLKGSKAAESYRLALQLYLKDPNLNSMLSTAKGWFGGVSKSEMLVNDSNLDNNTVRIPSKEYSSTSNGFFNV